MTPIEQIAETYAIKNCPSCKRMNTYDSCQCHILEDAWKAGHAHRDAEVAALQKESARYKRLFELAKQFKDKAEKKAFENHVAAVNIESEKDMNDILTKEVAALREALKEADEYLSQTTYEKGQPVMLNSIGAGSKIHNNIKNALKIK